MSNLPANIENLYLHYKDLLKNQQYGLLKDFLSNISNINAIYEKNIKDKKKIGAFYTKSQLADYISNASFNRYLENFLKKVGASNFKELTIEENIIKLSKENLLNLLEELKKIKILDPACGSGIFLLSIANLLFNLKNLIYLKLEIKPQYQSKDLIWRIKTEILTNNLYGMDIDKSAIKICEMNLFNWLIKSIDKDDLKSGTLKDLKLKFNLKEQNALLDIKIKYKYDLIIGNPPYGNLLKPSEKENLKNTIIFTNDVYCAFLIQALKLSNGIIGFLIPKSFLLRQNYIDLRNYLLNNSIIYQITDLGSKIFKGVTNEVQIFLYEKNGIKNLNNKKISKIVDISDNLINLYLDHQFDQLQICDQNTNCDLYDKLKRFFVYTFEDKCPICEHKTRALNRIRIKLTSEALEIINYIERNSNLNYLNIRDFKMVRGEEEAPLKELRNRLQNKKQLELGNDYFLINAKYDIEKFKIRRNKVVNLSGLSTKKNILYYKSPKLLIKHNSIYPVTVYVKDKAIFTSSVYSLLGEETQLKALSLLLNSKLMRFYCIYGINNQQDTTINLNQYMIRHLPLNLPENLELFSKIYDFINLLIKLDNLNAYFFMELTDLIVYQIYFKNLKELPNLLNIVDGYIKNCPKKMDNLENISSFREIIEKDTVFKSTKKQIYINPWIQEINKI